MRARIGRKYSHAMHVVSVTEHFEKNACLLVDRDVKNWDKSSYRMKIHDGTDDLLLWDRNWVCSDVLASLKFAGLLIMGGNDFKAVIEAIKRHDMIAVRSEERREG